MLSGTLTWLCTMRTQHARSGSGHHGTGTFIMTVEAWSRPSLLWSARSGWWAHLQGLHEQWDGSGSWICAGTLSLASPHWHTFVLGKCPTGMFQGDAALCVRTASAIDPAAWLVCLSNQPRARCAPVGLSATLIGTAPRTPRSREKSVIWPEVNHLRHQPDELWGRTQGDKRTVNLVP